MGMEIRLFPGIDAFLAISGMRFAWSTSPSLHVAKQHFDSVVAASEGCGAMGCAVSPPDPGCASEIRAFTPRITRFLAPANTEDAQKGP
jgi:hypothetical protein